MVFHGNLARTVQTLDQKQQSAEPWAGPPSFLVRDALSMPKGGAGMKEPMRALLGALQAKSPHTASHCVRVGRYAAVLAEAIGLPEARVAHVERCGLLHDIGKLGVPEGVLEKPGRLTGEEWGLIQFHPVIGATILRNCASLTALLPAVAMHHERWDGEGYPYRARGESIPLEARILAICDAYDTMTSPRPYKGPLDPVEALRRIEAGAGTQFDPELAGLFLRVMG